MLHQIKAVVTRSPRMLAADALGVMALGVMLIGALHLPDLV